MRCRQSLSYSPNPNLFGSHVSLETQSRKLRQWTAFFSVLLEPKPIDSLKSFAGNTCLHLFDRQRNRILISPVSSKVRTYNLILSTAQECKTLIETPGR